MCFADRSCAAIEAAYCVKPEICNAVYGEPRRQFALTRFQTSNHLHFPSPASWIHSPLNQTTETAAPNFSDQKPLHHTVSSSLSFSSTCLKVETILPLLCCANLQYLRVASLALARGMRSGNSIPARPFSCDGRPVKKSVFASLRSTSLPFLTMFAISAGNGIAGHQILAQSGFSA